MDKSAEPATTQSVAFLRRRRAARLLALVFFLPNSAALAAGTLEKAGDVLQVLLPAAGLGATYLYDDPEGRRQWLYSGATTIGSVLALKPLVEKVRPSGATTTSFPSGHSAGAFWGAAFLNTRYGAWWGVPAYGLAALTGYSRIKADKHYADDVVAGASIALLSNWYWARPIDERVSFAPMLVPGGYGVMMTATDTTGVQFGDRALPGAAPSRLRFDFEIAFADVSYNQVRAPAPGGTQFDLGKFENVNDTTTTAIVKFDWDIAPRQSLQFILAPFEARNGGTFPRAVNYAGTPYAANQQIVSSYTYYDFRALYRYDLAPESALIALAGAGMAVQRTSLRLSGPIAPVSENVQAWKVLPVVYGQLGIRFARNWEAVAEASGMSLSGDKLIDVSASLRYRFNKLWDVSAGYRQYKKQTDSAQLYNSVSYNIPFVGIRHSW